ncbi:PepSY domain-containing protein [Streptomyces albus subsp. chlorinus]|uniref:PepSY domain-containing protein n=1 Tax=Streptomyces albus TaxID=1888 RepID=UPI00156EC582|nr:PepSY domain-containing protein [Streptomyces albus]NSC23955.1 PepSY domain-containing protein [Streptomyces albus subsp. chlorinus]
MKRKVIIATVTAAALVGGGTATAFGVAGGGGDHKPAAASSSNVRPVDHDDDHADGHDDDRDDRDDHADHDGRDDDGRDGGRADRAEETGASGVSFAQAAQAVLKEVPGTISELELDTDRDQLVWEADVLGKDGKWHDVTLDAAKGHVVKNRVDAHKDENRSVVRGAGLDAAAAGKKAAAASKGTVTSVSLDDDGRDKGRWEADTVDKKGDQHELVLDGTSGKVLHHETERGDDD